jgi:mannitol-1-phosphate/altronate dehydrogenase
MQELYSLPELVQGSWTKAEAVEGWRTVPGTLSLQAGGVSTIKISPSPQDVVLSPNQKLVLPNYDRKGFKEAIVHFGVGGFHRSHMAVYIDDLLRKGLGDWCIVGVGLKEPYDRFMRDALASQDYLYTVVERDNEKVTGRVIGSIAKVLFAPEDPEAVLRRLSSPVTHLVSLTITEGGYFLDAHGNLQFDHPDLQHDLQHPSSPRTVFGFIVEALRRRFASGLAPFTVLSCDNLQGNGDATRRATLGFARLRVVEGDYNIDSDFLEWIETQGSFPNSMVDRITPQTTEEDKTFIRSYFQVDDCWPVVTEPFRQWIIEEDPTDTFTSSMPPLELVGVRFVKEVAPYEHMKLRLLNATHSALAYLGYLSGHRLVHQVTTDPLFVRYLSDTLDSEVIPFLPMTPGIDPGAYKRELLQRFSNKRIQDQVLRLCSQGSAKVPKFILPSICEYQAQRPTELPRGLTLAVAGWLRFLEGKDESGDDIPLDDANLQALKGSELPSELFGELGRSSLFSEGLKHYTARLKVLGVRKVLESEFGQ